ncbi:MAG: Bug family tripartite tricarboxylate transporter substrate binding protein [Burkholderiales bacterium]
MGRDLSKRALVLIAALAGAAAGGAPAQTYPNKVIRVINPAAPGGNSDILFRLLSPKMSEILGQPLVIDYRPGAGGIIATELASKAAPDGYTTIITGAFFQINPSLKTKLPFDPIRDFTPLGLIVDLPAALVVHPSLPVKSPKELIALARARPGELLYSSSGIGALGHLSGELLGSISRTKMTHVPYQGVGPSVTNLLGGHVQLSFVSVPAVIGFVQQGKLRMIAQCGATRFQSLPDVPTMQEAGVPGFVVSSGFSFVGPAGIPRPIVEKLNSALVQTLRDPAIRKMLVERGADPVGNTPEEHAAYLKAEIDKWRRVVASAGIKPE